MKVNALRLICAMSFLVGLGFTQGCGEDTDDGTTAKYASFTVQLSSTSASFMSLDRGMALATSLAAKLGGVDLINECAEGNPPGPCLELGLDPDPDIWVNEGCGGDIAQCTPANTEFFELIDPTAANTELNSQGRSIQVGTFTHVRVYFLNNDENNAVQCDGAAHAFRPAVPIVVPLATPLTVAEGDSVTVLLNYDPSLIDCAVESTISDMFDGMTATATLN